MIYFFIAILGFCFHENLNIFEYIYIFFITNASDMKNNGSIEIGNGFKQ